MRWHVALKLTGSILLVAAATVMSLQVHVGGPGGSGRSCGSSLDVVTDRTSWEVWYAQDTIDAPAGSPSQLLRTMRCPGAVNARTVVAGVVGATGVVALVGAAASRRARPRSPVPVMRLRRLGTTVTAVAATLMIVGVLALGVLLANRDAALFVFVRRSMVAAIGIILLAPVLALLTAGRALSILGRALEDRENVDGTA